MAALKQGQVWICRFPGVLTALPSLEKGLEIVEAAVQVKQNEAARALAVVLIYLEVAIEVGEGLQHVLWARAIVTEVVLDENY
jgi:hypothetical protein